MTGDEEVLKSREHTRYWSPQTGDYLVICRDDSNEFGPGEFQIATRRAFVNLEDARDYLVGISPSRDPMIVQVCR